LHFGLSQEQLLLQETLRSFAAAELPPKRLRELFDAGTGHDDGLWRGLAEMGVTGLVVPEALGGAGFGILELALACEVAGAAALPGALLEHSLACLAIARAGTDAQRERWLPRLASGETIATVAFGEPEDRWRPDEWTAALSGGRLSGRKRWVPHLAHAGLVVVGSVGGGLALLELSQAGAAGVRVAPQPGIDRTRAIHELVLDAAEAELLGTRPGDPPGDVAASIVDAGLVALAADAFGAATRLVALSVEYAKDRKQFGFPIAQFQAVKHQLARMGTELEPTRALLWYAAHALDERQADAARHAAMAKALIGECAMQIARDAVEVHGGLGFTWECDVQLWFKRVMFDRSALGAPAAQRERLAALAGW
jgi:alkylation response protein AidB-like acyl-CoA dehydrogenase